MSKHDKPDEQKAVGDLLKDWPNPKPGAGSPGKIHTAHGSPSIPAIRAGGHTVTSSAYTSAEIFSPDQAPMIKAYQEAIAQADKGDVFLLAEGKVTPQQIGINTGLDSDITQPFAGFDLSERQAQADRDHEKDLEGIKTSGSVKTEVIKQVLIFVFGVIAALVAVKLIPG